MGNLSVYNFGQLGVNVDKDPLQLEDGELATAQNVIPNPIGDGGLVNRHGLVKLNAVAAADTSTGIIGGVGVPLVNLSAAARTIYIGRTNTAHGGAWAKSTDNFASVATVVTDSTPANPRGKNASASTGSTDYGIADFSTGATFLVGQPGSGCVVNNVLYYAADNYIAYNGSGYTAPTIRKFDGTVDSYVCTLPYNPDAGATSVCKGVLSMLTANGYIYLTTFDGGTTSADYRGRAFQLNTISGALSPLGATFTLGHLPYALTYWMGRLWVGSHTGDTASNGNIYAFRPGIDAAWTLDHTGTNGNYCSLVGYNGYLYAGTMQAAATFAKIEQRDSLGTYTTSLTATGGTARQYNAVVSMATFGTNLYACYWNNDGTAIGKIYKYDGTSWTTAYNGSGATAIQTSGMFLYNNKLYAVGNSNSQITLLFTTDGSSWTDRTTNFGGAVNGLGVFYGMLT